MADPTLDLGNIISSITGGIQVSAGELVKQFSDPKTLNRSYEDSAAVLKADPGSMVSGGVGMVVPAERALGSARLFKDKFDKVLKAEIPDEGASLAAGQGPGQVFVGRLGDYLIHPKLYDVMPELADLNITVKDLGPKLAGSFVAETGTVNATSRSVSKDDMLSTILHEIQHGVQSLSKWKGQGTNTAHELEKLENRNLQFGLSVDPEVMKSAAKMNYLKDYGELSARTTEARRNFTAEQLDKLPYLDHLQMLKDQLLIKK